MQRSGPVTAFFRCASIGSPAKLSLGAEVGSTDLVRRLLAILRKDTAEGVVDVLQNLQVVMGRVTFIGRWSVLVKLPRPNNGDLAWCAGNKGLFVFHPTCGGEAAHSRHPCHCHIWM